MTSPAVAALLVSLKVACCATLAILPLSVAVGWLLARRTFPFRSLIETVVALPMVLPPTAIGYLLLSLLAYDGPLGSSRIGVDLDLLLTWKGAVVASALMAFPLAARMARLAFEGVDPRLESVGRTLGLGPLRVFMAITLPLARRGLLAAVIMAFTRALGEFGATVIVAGNIPGQTQTLALAIFSDIQSGREREAMGLVAITVVLAFLLVWVAEWLMRDRRRAA